MTNPTPLNVPDGKASLRRGYRALLIGVTALFYLIYAYWPSALMAVPHCEQWFIDSYAILASNDALAQGINPYGYNALDYFGRPHVYSHWWLWLGDLGLTREDNTWLALMWIGGFFALALTWLRPRSLREVVGFALVLCSGSIVLAIDRANNDLLIFILLAGVVPGLLARHRAWRWLTVLWIALAAGLKYYPAVAALMLLTGEDAREVRGRIGLMVVALLLVGFSLRDDLSNLGGTLPAPKGLYSFGAQVIFTPLNWSEPMMRLAACLLGAGIFAVGWRSDWLAAWTAPANAEQQREYLGFVLGAALLCGCFWTGMNFGYRWIFAVWMAPWIWRRAADQQGTRVARFFSVSLVALLLGALWSDALVLTALRSALVTTPFAVVQDWARLAFLAVQPVVWLCFAALLMVLARFVRAAWQRLGPRQPGGRSAV